MSDLRESFEEQVYALFWKSFKNPSYLSRRSMEDSNTISFLNSQDSMVDTWKFISKGEAWNN
jgi:hypothetical protein